MPPVLCTLPLRTWPVAQPRASVYITRRPTSAPLHITRRPTSAPLHITRHKNAPCAVILPCLASPVPRLCTPPNVPCMRTLAHSHAQCASRRTAHDIASAAQSHCATPPALVRNSLDRAKQLMRRKPNPLSRERERDRQGRPQNSNGRNGRRHRRRRMGARYPSAAARRLPRLCCVSSDKLGDNVTCRAPWHAWKPPTPLGTHACCWCAPARSRRMRHPPWILRCSPPPLLPAPPLLEPPCLCLVLLRVACS